ncbi:MAG: DUF3619 family protein [Pseudomonadota bacterium]
MNKKSLDAEQIKHLLNRSVTQLDSTTLQQLRAARNKAMSRYEAHNAAPALAWTGPLANIGQNLGAARKYQWVAAVLLAVCVFSGTVYWHHSEKDTSDVDIAILTDELPIHVYLD